MVWIIGFQYANADVVFISSVPGEVIDFNRQLADGVAAEIAAIGPHAKGGSAGVIDLEINPNLVGAVGSAVSRLYSKIENGTGPGRTIGCREAEFSAAVRLVVDANPDFIRRAAAGREHRNGKRQLIQRKNAQILSVGSPYFEEIIPRMEHFKIDQEAVTCGAWHTIARIDYQVVNCTGILKQAVRNLKFERFATSQTAVCSGIQVNADADEIVHLAVPLEVLDDQRYVFEFV